MTRIAEISYNGWPHCVEIKNDLLRLIVTADVGPRVIYCGNAGADFNLFYEDGEQRGKTGGDEWRIYGGHRLWHSPQEGSRPNQRDNEPVPYTIEDSVVTFSPPGEEATRVQKELRISLAPGEPRVCLRHRIYNRGLWPIRFASWALTALREGGTEILPIPQNDTVFMPNYAIAFWPWTRPNDPRFTLGEKYMILRHDKKNTRWFKIGYRNTDGWGAYLLNGFLFVKRYALIPGEDYPDYGSTFETYADERFVELESLGPLKTVEPGAYTEHVEEWYVFNGVPLLSTETEIEDQLAARIRKL